jgi:hypothetical protein
MVQRRRSEKTGTSRARINDPGKVLDEISLKIENDQNASSGASVSNGEKASATNSAMEVQ